MKTVLILLGPTGVGKTEASLLLAAALETEIISADSMQIYRGMDIGTAKPTPEQRAAIVHHMIDVTDSTESFSAGRYIEMIEPILANLQLRGKIPLIVGGTGLYIKAITRGIFSGPSADWGLREELLSLEQQNPGALYSHLLKIDPDSAAKISRNDTRRLLRAIEVCFSSRERMSSLQERLTKPLPYDFIKIGLTRSRKELYRMIDARVDEMIREGLVEEARKILSMSPDRAPMQAIGYKEFTEFFTGAAGLDRTVEIIKRNSRRYAKRQFTWFSREAEVNWIDVTGVFDSCAIFKMTKDRLRESYPGKFPIISNGDCSEILE